MNESIAQLLQRAHRIRRNVLRMARGKGDGYVGQGLGAADILAAIYFGEMRFDPARLDWPDRDRFVLSTGHYSIVLFATLAELGVFREEELATYGADESRLEMSTCITTPGVEITGGSLGHGLSQSVGMALGARLSGRDFRVFNFLSDGELQEGVTWEAAMAAAHYRLGNLTALVDVNNMQADGEVAGVMTIEPVADKWRAFGWYAQTVNGNSIEELAAALDAARAIQDQPKVLVCHTTLGNGVPIIQQLPKAHFVRVEQAEWDAALQQLAEANP
jgi:transketolase